VWWGCGRESKTWLTLATRDSTFDPDDGSGSDINLMVMDED